MGPTWVLSAPDGLRVGPMNLAMRGGWGCVGGWGWGGGWGGCWHTLDPIKYENSLLCFVLMSWYHYSDIIMSVMASQITGASIVCSIVCLSADQKKSQISTSLRNFVLKFYSLIIRLAKNRVALHAGSFRRYNLLGWMRVFCSHAKYHHTKLGHTIVMNIWNVDTQQRQRYLTWAESCYIMFVSNKLSDLLVSIMLLSQHRVTIIFTVRFVINNIAYNIKESLEGQSNWNMG